MKFYLTKRTGALLSALMMGTACPTAQASTDYITSETTSTLESWEDYESKVSGLDSGASSFERGSVGLHTASFTFDLLKFMCDPNIPTGFKCLALPVSGYVLCEGLHFALTGKFWIVDKVKGYLDGDKKGYKIDCECNGQMLEGVKLVRVTKVTKEQVVNYGPRTYCMAPYDEQPVEVQKYYKNENIYNAAMKNRYFDENTFTGGNNAINLPTLEEINNVYEDNFGAAPHTPGF